MNPYAIAFAALAKAYKIAKGVSPKGLDLLKLKQQARQKAIDAQKVIKVNFDKGNNWMKNQADRIKQYNRQNKESAQRFKEKMKKEKSLGDKLKDYKGDPDAMREGGLLGYAVGGRIQNLRNAYQSNPTLQNQFADQQDYIDLFDLNTNQFTPTTKSAPASLNTSTPQEILTPNIVKPIIIPGSESEGITSINRSRTNMNQPNAMGGKTPGLKAAAQRSLTGLQTLLDSPFVEFNPLNPMFLFNLAKAGKEKITNQFSNIIAEKKKVADEAIAAQREFDRLNALRQLRDEQSMSGGPGETTQGTFGSSVNDASTFSDYS